MLPRDSDLPGWKLQEAPRGYDASNILLFGGDISVLAGPCRLEEAAIVSFTAFSDPGRDLAVELYRTETVADAFGLVSRLRPFNRRESPVPAEAYEACAAQDALFFRKGRYCGTVRVSRYYADAARDMRTCADTVCSSISAPREEPPWFVDAFGDRNMRCEVVYYAEGIRDVPGVKRLCMRPRTVEKTACSVVYTRGETPRRALRDFMGMLAGGSDALVLRDAGTRLLAQKRMPGGIVLMISVEREWIFGVLDAADEKAADAIIEALRGELPSPTGDNGG